MPRQQNMPDQPPTAREPSRWRVLSELGRTQTLTSGREAFASLNIDLPLLAASGNFSPNAAPPHITPNVAPDSSPEFLPDFSPGSPLHLSPSLEPGSAQNADWALFLGLGPEPSQLPALLQEAGWSGRSGGAVYYLECPEFMAQLSGEWHDSIPDWFKALAPADLPGLLERGPGRVTFIRQHAQSARLFPSFWGPVLAELRWRALGMEPGRDSDKARITPAPPHCSGNQAGSAGPANFPNAATRGSRRIILVGTEHSLLHLELTRAFQELGRTVSSLPPDDNGEGLARLLRDPDSAPPDLFLSLNCEGFGALGENFHLLKLSGVPCASWFVDNPWNSLSGLRAPFWKELRLFCTDASFVEPLKACGAAQVEFLPLAVDPLLFAPPAEELASVPMFFVGRSSFPGKQEFFSGLSVPPELAAESRSLLERGRRPDFHWWARRLKARTARQPDTRSVKQADARSAKQPGARSVKQADARNGPAAHELWPGKEARRIGLGAENASAFWRAACLRAALPFNPFICGDPGWHELLPPGTVVHEPVDYYHALPKHYASARITLNATSLLLPAGLNQRHFDVWAAGGFLLTDYTPGLNIFPQELVSPVSFRKSSEIPQLVEKFSGDNPEYQALKQAWRQEILARHRYAHRVERILESLANKK